MIHSGLNPPPAAREGHKPKPPNCPPTPTGILAVQGTAVPGKSPLAPRDSVQGLCLERGRGGPLHLPTQTLLTSMGAEPSPALQSPELLGPRPLGQQSAACPCASPNMASSSSSSTSSGTFALGPWGRITSQGICGWPGQGLSANVSTPPPTRECRGPFGRAQRSEASGVPKVGGRGIVRSSCSFGTHMASPFSFLGRQCCFRGRAAGGGGRVWGLVGAGAVLG